MQLWYLAEARELCKNMKKYQDGRLGRIKSEPAFRDLKGERHSFSIFQYVEENDRIVFIKFCRSPQIFIDFEIEAISFVEVLN